MNFLQSRLGPFPVWVWGLVIIGGVVVFFLVKKMQSGTTTNASGTLGQNSAGQVNPLNPNNDPNVDSNTGVPYQIEEAVDPATGQLYYFELTNGASSPGQAGGGPMGPTGPLPPQPAPPPTGGGPGRAPATAPSASPIPSVQAGTQVKERPGIVRTPPGGVRPPPGPVRTPPAGRTPPGREPPQPSERTSPEREPPTGTGDEWAYPFWAGQGGTLYA